MRVLVQDLRFGIRTLVKNPVFTLVSVLALAIGIGANSVIEAVLLRPLPYYESNRLVKIWEKQPHLLTGSVSYANFIDWQDQNDVFEELAAYQTGDYNLTNGDEPEQIQNGTRKFSESSAKCKRRRRAARTLLVCSGGFVGQTDLEGW